MDRDDRPRFREFEFDLHAAVFVARGDNRRSPIPQVDKKPPCVCCRHPKEGGWRNRTRIRMDRHACTHDGRYFRDNPEGDAVTIAANLDWRIRLSPWTRMRRIAGS